MVPNPEATKAAGRADPICRKQTDHAALGDRSKVVIEPMLTDQWFVDSEKIVGPALDAVRSGEIKILPESGEKVYFNWLENASNLVYFLPALVGASDPCMV